MTRLALALAALATPAAAQVQMPCGTRSVILHAIVERAGELPRAVMLGSGETGVVSLIEVYARPDGATWTLVVTRPDGLTCLVAAGIAFEPIPLPPPGEPG